MLDIDKHISHWLKGSNEDFIVAKEILDSGRIRHGLFFLHLGVEKLLKAIVCKTTNDLAPQTHNLSRLAELAKIELPADKNDFLADLNSFNIEGRYPDLALPVSSEKAAFQYHEQAMELQKWLKNQL